MAFVICYLILKRGKGINGLYNFQVYITYIDKIIAAAYFLISNGKDKEIDILF